MATTVTVTCPDCKQQINVPPEIVGKKIRCKSCEHIFVARAGSSPGPAPKGGKPPDKGAVTKAPVPGKPTKPAKPKPDEEEEDANPYGVTNLDLAPRCPNCANEMESEDAIICLSCGYNTLTRETARTRKVRDVTGGQRFLWLLPGILCVIAVLLILGNIITNIIVWSNYSFESAGEDAKLYEQAGSCCVLWWCLGWLWVAYKATRFAIKRLIHEPSPPEVEEE